MPREVKAGSVQDRILRVLAERYPATVEEVALAIGVRLGTVRLEVKRLRAQRLVILESPGGKEYVALSGEGFRVMGISPSQVTELKKRGKLPPAKPRDEHDPAFM